jgi:hypothetical protein
MGSSRYAGGCLWIALVCFPVVLEMPSVSAQAPDKSKKEQAPIKRYAFRVRNKPWTVVFELLADKTGLPIICSCSPAGAFTFIPPKNARYTLGQILDIVNAGLASKELVLVNGGTSLALFSVQAVHNHELAEWHLPYISLDQLDAHGSTEDAIVTIEPKFLSATELAKAINKKLPGKWGKAEALSDPNKLILTGQVQWIRKSLTLLSELDTKTNPKRPPGPPLRRGKSRTLALRPSESGRLHP